MRITGLRLRNFRAFRDVELRDLPRMAVFVGANGTGKSTLFSVFEFLREALRTNVTEAFAKIGGPRGFQDVRSRGAEGPIEIELHVEAEVQPSHFASLRYLLQLEEDQGKPVVARELLRNTEEASPLLDLHGGRGAIPLARETIALHSPDLLALKVVGQFKEINLAAVTVHEALTAYHLADFRADRARSERPTGSAEHLSRDGENLPLVVDHLQRRHPEVLAQIIERLRHRVPGLTNVESKVTEDGRVLLRLQDSFFKEPFLASHVSDGTLTMLAYLVLLLDPEPHQLLCVEEPETHLYPTLLAELAEELRVYSLRGGQVMVTTHSPDFLNAIELDEVYWLVKRNGATEIRRGRDHAQVAASMADGDKLGRLWKLGLFDDAEPR